MTTRKTCPHDKSFHIHLSGTKVREKLQNGEMLPKEFSRPEVAAVLMKGMKIIHAVNRRPEGIGMTFATNIVWHQSIVTKEDRQKLNNHKSAVLWFTGRSGSGKSTLTVQLEKELYKLGIRAYRLDGDNIRHGLNKDLGFRPEDRTENIRRIGEVAKLMVDAGLITLTAFISPYRKDRAQVRNIFGVHEFIEIYVKCSLETCEKRDPKGLYKKHVMVK